jgi:small-conductance mechanosensitive channel
MSNFWKNLIKPDSGLAKFLLFAFVLFFFSLEFLPLLGPIKEFLNADALSLQIGNAKFSAYLIIQGVIIIATLLWLTGFLSDIAAKFIKKIPGINSNNRNLITKALQILIYFIAFQIGMNFLGIDLTALAVFSGALGIGIGFGLQKVTSNFISGIIILFEKTVQNDDLIELNDGTLGFLRNTGSRASLIETYDGKEVMVPNEDLITNRVINYTHSNKKARIKINIGVSYDCDIEKAQKLILDAAIEHPRTTKTPEPLCFLEEFADSSVNFILLFWVNDVVEGRYGPKSDVLFSIWNKFKDNNIEIPYPQRDIHIREGNV